MIAGAVAIHVPKYFGRLLRLRNWTCLSDVHSRKISTEHRRHTSTDAAFEEFQQYLLPATAVLFDEALELEADSSFKEAAVGLLQLGFGLYQLIGDDG